MCCALLASSTRSLVQMKVLAALGDDVIYHVKPSFDLCSAAVYRSTSPPNIIQTHDHALRHQSPTRFGPVVQPRCEYTHVAVTFDHRYSLSTVILSMTGRIHAYQHRYYQFLPWSLFLFLCISICSYAKPLSGCSAQSKQHSQVKRSFTASYPFRPFLDPSL